jgi:5-formyltetrahydrofolate cyclo-ligase
LKRGIREVLLKKRDEIAITHKKLKEKAIREKLFSTEEIKNAKCILFYASFRSEVDTMQCIKKALKMDKLVVLPQVRHQRRTLKLYEIKSTDELKPGYMGIWEPEVRKDRERALKDIDLAIIPGAGFDIEGNRLGYGAGYYDKLLSRAKEHITTIALAFEEQIIPRVPREEHDVVVDKIITEKRVIICKKTRTDEYR